MTGIIYAYKDNDRYQTMIEHSIGSLEVMERESFKKYLGNSYFAVVARRISDNLNDKVDAEIIRRIVRTLVLMHDIGKTEKSIQESAKSHQKLSFKFHEAFGAVYFYKFKAFESLNVKENTASILRRLSILSVWNHLNALRNLDASVKSYDVLGGNKIQLKKYGSDVVDEINRMEVSDILILDKPEDYDENDFEDMRRFALIESEKSRELSKLYSLFLSPIVIADSINSCESRQDNKGSCCNKVFLKPFCGGE